MDIKLFTLVSDLRNSIDYTEDYIDKLKKNYPITSNSYIDLDNIQNTIDAISSTYYLLLEQLDVLVSVQANAIQNNKV